MHFVRSLLVWLGSLALLAACANAPPRPDILPRPAIARAPSSPEHPSGVTASPVSSAAPSSPSRASSFRCTEIIGLTITAEWYGAGFEELVEDDQFQARTRPHTFVDQWAEPQHEAWSAPITSPCRDGSESPDRVVLFAANWKLTSADEWLKVLTAFVATAKQRYPALRDLELYTVLRGPGNQSCGDAKSRVEPFIDAAIERVAASEPALVHAGPRLEAADCSVFEKGGPHFTEEGRKRVAKQLADVLR